MLKKLLILVTALVVTACAAPIPVIDYAAISNKLASDKAQIIGSNVEQPFPYDTWAISVVTVDGKEVGTKKSLWLKEVHAPLVLEPGTHIIEIRMKQGRLIGYAEFEFNLKANKTYVARALAENKKYVHLWLEDFATGEDVTERKKARRQASGNVVIII